MKSVITFIARAAGLVMLLAAALGLGVACQSDGNGGAAAVTAAVAANRTAWRWQRCDAAAMATNCKLAQSGSSTQTCTESTPAAGADTDVGKYLRAYAYHADSANSNVGMRTQTPIVVPVVAAPAALPTMP